MITELIEYFAKFPDRDGVLKMFSKSTSEIVGYADLKATIEALGDPLLPDIKDFLVSTDETVISSRIKNMQSFFMLLEYAGLQSSAPNRAYVRDTSMNLSVIIAHPFSGRNRDQAEEHLIMDQSMELITEVAIQMDTDSKLMCSNQRYIPGSVLIAPVEPAMLYGCIGWAMTFTKNEPLYNE